MRNSYVNFCKFLSIAFALFLFIGCAETKQQEKKTITKRPNFLILMSDNQYVKDLGCYGNKQLNTPAINKIAKEGVKFENAFCASPSCSPARAAMLTGQEIWRLGAAANLWGDFPRDLPVYSEMLDEAGYLVGIEGKGWGPGKAEKSGWEINPGGERYSSFEEFYNEREKGQPWMYWVSSRNPHRPFKRNGWKKSGVKLEDIEVPPYLPDTEEVRKDIAAYYDEIQGFDEEVASYMSLIGEMGQAENTIVIVCSDNGWQMPRGLANLYEFGTKVPLIIHWPEHFKGGREIEDFVTLNDFAPTFLELAGLPIPEEMTAKSLVNILQSEQSGMIEDRDFVVTARERHAFVRKGGLGYPGRAIQTKDFLYIKNFEPSRWPAGDPPLFGDVDAHMLQYECGTKLYMLEHQNDPEVKPMFDLAFGKRPSEELFDLRKDPNQMVNLANDPAYAQALDSMRTKLTDYLTETKDPRVIGGQVAFDEYEYYMDADKKPKPGYKAIEALGLDEEYNYL
ncbi:sulfatase family protein [Flammeovirga aprica]|uniref:Sulfatase n=1 Tax=Flammeovirga aprica JL-4 TaxID=694437 RepID=A0A7X9NZM8_9BACT|nr:sulfatase [Flammeovirga aprica]NME66803.1 sulfatase [Flammeovirga aprica JL-4]